MKKGQTTAAMILRAIGLIAGSVVTIIYARVLEPEQFGEFSFVIAVITLLSLPHVRGLRQVLVRDLAYAQANSDQEQAGQIWQWVRNRSMIATPIFAAPLVIWILFGSSETTLKWHLTLGLALYLLLPIPRLLAGILHGSGRIIQSQIPELILAPLLTISLLIGLDTRLGPAAPSIQDALLVFAAALIADALLCAAFLRFGPAFPIWYGGAGLALPKLSAAKRRTLTYAALSLGMISSIHIINNNLDVIMLGILSTDVQVGLYKAAAVVSTIAAFGLGVVTMVIMPQIARLHAQADKAALQSVLTKATRLTTAFALGGTIIIWTFGREILTFILNEQYNDGYLALLILTFGQCANACFGPVALVLNMTENHRITLIGLSISVAVNIALNLLLIPRIGMEGAAIATAVSIIIWNIILSRSLTVHTGYRSSILPLNIRLDSDIN